MTSPSQPPPEPETDRGLLGQVISWRVSQAATPSDPPEWFLNLQAPIWRALSRYYFRCETDGWERIPDRNCLFVGVHSGGTLTMDAWTLVTSWQRRYGNERVLHGTAHDVLMALPGLGGRTGFVRQAIRSGVPIVPVTTVGGHDTVFVLSEDKWLAAAVNRHEGMRKALRGTNLPIIAGFPLPLAVELLPAHLPLPAKIRTEFLDPIAVDSDPERANDKAYLQDVYDQVEAAIQAGMTKLARRRRFPVFG